MNGVVYIAKGGHGSTDHMRELNYSVRSLKSIHPEMPVTLFTSAKYESQACDCFDQVFVKDRLEDREKQNLLQDSPYDRTLYLDTDTQIVAPVDDLFGLLDRFDIAACIDHARKTPEAARVWPAYDVIPGSFSEFAGGVILFRKRPAVDEFFDLWRRRYAEWCEVSGRRNDQPSFRVALWDCDLRVFVLPPEYNIRTQEKRDKIKNIVPRIHHWHRMYDNVKRNPQRF